MIVRDEEHVVAETLESVGPLVDYWVIVDTGSQDGTIAAVEAHMRSAGIPGEIHERPWRDFGSNRTEALELCAGKCDYIWVIDADDLVVGDLDLSGLSADSYLLRYGDDPLYWRKQLFREGLRWRYEGVVHEYPACLEPVTEARLEGDYRIESRRLGSRNRDPRKYHHDAALLEEALERDPGDARSVFYLAQSLFDAGETGAALERYTQRAAMGGWEEERFYSLWRRAVCLAALGEPWGAALDAYLQAWNARPTRAEPLHAIAAHYRACGDFHLGYLFASRACEIPLPEEDDLFVSRGAHSWAATDEKAICAFYVGRHEESFELSTGLLEGDELPGPERERVQANRDICVPGLTGSRETYPRELIDEIVGRAGSGGDVTLSITSCRRLPLFERTINSFINCCTDLDRIGRWICVDNGSTTSDRERMKELYPFLELVPTDPDEGERHAESMNVIAGLAETPLWLHLEDDWGFFWRGPYIERAADVLAEDESIAQVAFNPSYAETLEGGSIDRRDVRRTHGLGLPYRVHEHVDPGSEDWGRLIGSLPPGSQTMAYWPNFTLRPSLIRSRAIPTLAPFASTGHFELEAAQRFTAAGNRTASFDQVTCLHLGRRTWEPAGSELPSAYELVGDGTHPAHATEAGTVPAVVINLNRRADRWESFQRMARRAAGAGFAEACRRVEAIDGTGLTADPDLEHMFRGNDFGLRRGIVACALSHIEQWRSVAAEARGVHLILEDDAILADGFPQHLAAVRERLRHDHPGADVILLGHLTADELVSDDRPAGGLRPLPAAGYVGGLFAYLLTPRGARRLLGIVERDGIQNGIDVFLARKADELEILECVPAIATAAMAQLDNDVDSDIQRDFEPVSAPAPHLADLAPSCAVAEVVLAAGPGWRCEFASVRPSGAGYSLTLLGTDPDATTPRGYGVTLDQGLDPASVEELESGEGVARVDGNGKLSVSTEAGTLSMAVSSIAPGGSSGHQLVLADADGHALSSSSRFRLSRDGGERCTSLVERDGELVIAFVTGDGRPMLASLELEEALAALSP